MYKLPQFTYDPPSGPLIGPAKQTSPTNIDSLSSREVRIDGLDVGLRRLRRRPGVFIIPRSKVVEVVRGAPSFSADDLLTFDSKSEIVLLVRHIRGRLVVAMLDGWIRIWKTRSPTALNGVAIDLPAPQVHTWLQDLPCASWLATLASQLSASEHVLEQAAAVGVLGRLWEPPDGNYAPLNTHLRAWADQLTPETLSNLSDAALAQASDMTHALEGLSRLDHAHASHTAHWIVDWREMLESVAWPLGVRGSAANLDTALRTLDRATTMHWSRIDDALDHSHALHPHHWRAVGWQEPQAWWGGSDG